MGAESVPALAGRYVGQSVTRVEDPRFLAGKGRYVDDLTLPGMLHASFVRSPHAHARIVSIDVSAALALDGVLAVLTGEDFVDVPPLMPGGVLRDEIVDVPRHVLPRDKARFVGEAIAVVIATTAYIAEDGRDLVQIEWEPLEVLLDPEKSLEPDAPLLHEALGTNNVAHMEFSNGDVDGAFSRSRTRLQESLLHRGFNGRADHDAWDRR